MSRVMILAAAAAVVVAALGVGYWWGQSRSDAASPTSSAEAASGERKVLYWYDPMVPDQHFEKPGKSPFMDMQLVPKYAGEVSEGGIAVAPGVRQNLGMRTVTVKRGRLAAALQVPGTIGWDLRQERIVSVRVDSIVDRLFVKAPYEQVRAGQPLASVIAPTWSTAMAEAEALGSAQSSSGRSLRSAAHERLRALGLPAGAGVRDGRVTLTVPVRGVVSEIGVREGQSAPTGTLMFRINGNETVWLEAAIPQAGIAGIKAGTPVEARVDARPGELFHGRVETLLPQVDMSSRTQRARIVLDNPGGVLAPGMFAQITLQPTGGIDVPLVPSEALIGTGAQIRVIVLGDDDKFRPVAVRTGRSGGGMTEILAGLKGGERIVSSGQFLIDSEANLSGALERLYPANDQPDSDAEASMPPEVMPGMPETTKPPREAPAAASPRKALSPTAVVPVAKPDTPSTTTPKPRQCRVLYWYDPMVADKHFDKPGKSPFMDMQLVPKFAPEADPACTIRDVEDASAAERQP